MRSVRVPGVPDDQPFSYSCASTKGRSPNYDPLSVQGSSAAKLWDVGTRGRNQGEPRRHSNWTAGASAPGPGTPSGGERAGRRGNVLLFEFQPAGAQAQSQLAGNGHDGPLASAANRHAFEAAHQCRVSAVA